MSNTLQIHFKRTGEIINAPYQTQSTASDLIAYVCEKSTIMPNADPSHYYLGIDNIHLFEGNQTVASAGLDKPGSFNFLHMCLRSHFLMELIIRAREKIWKSTPNSGLPKLGVPLQGLAEMPKNLEGMASERLGIFYRQIYSVMGVHEKLSSSQITFGPFSPFSPFLPLRSFIPLSPPVAPAP